MANKIYRFALGSAEAAYSGLWRLWTHEDEVHLAVRASNEEVALTIYPTGRWRITVGTAVSKWTRPKDFRPGWSRGPDLIIPPSDGPVDVPATDPHPTEPIHWLPPSAPGIRARFSLLIATPSAELSHWRPPEVPGSQNLVMLPLRTAGTLHLYRIDEPLTADDAAPSAAPAAGPRRLTVNVSADQTGTPSLREAHG
jgi:hypothetical protein